MKGEELAKKREEAERKVIKEISFNNAILFF